MPMIYLQDGGTISVCHDSTGTTQITHSQGRCALTIAGLTADQCYEIAKALQAEGDRQLISDAFKSISYTSSLYAALRADERVAANA